MEKSNILASIVIGWLALLLIVEAVSSGESHERIFGGQKAALGQFPHQVSLRRMKTVNLQEHFCGGVLINDHTVLSTANCMLGFRLSPQKVSIVVGTLTVKAQDPGTTYPVARIVINPLFDRNTMTNDISVIKTHRRIAFTNNVKPIELPTSNEADGNGATVSGWGRFDVSMGRGYI